MIQLTVTRTRLGTLSLLAETTLPGPPYTVPEVRRERFTHREGELAADFFARVWEWAEKVGAGPNEKSEPLVGADGRVKDWAMGTEPPREPSGKLPSEPPPELPSSRLITRFVERLYAAKNLSEFASAAAVDAVLKATGDVLDERLGRAPGGKP